MCYYKYVSFCNTFNTSYNLWYLSLKLSKRLGKHHISTGHDKDKGNVLESISRNSGKMEGWERGGGEVCLNIHGDTSCLPLLRARHHSSEDERHSPVLQMLMVWLRGGVKGNIHNRVIQDALGQSKHVIWELHQVWQRRTISLSSERWAGVWVHQLDGSKCIHP